MPRCYIVARKIGLPILLTPASSQNVVWFIAGPLLRPILQRVLPEWLALRIDMTVRGFEHRLRNKPFMIVGPSFLPVGPGSLELHTTDTEITKIITGRGTFRHYWQSEILKLAIGVFGPSILASSGNDWQLQRRIVAPVINEHVSATIWNESSKQATEMLSYFVEGSKGTASAGATDKSLEGLRRVAINVLGASAYGTPRRWIEEEGQAPHGYELGYINSLLAMTNNFAATVFFPPSLLSFPFLPASPRKFGVAKREFLRYVTNMIAKERANVEVNRNNIMSVMIKTSDQEKKESSSNKPRLHLSEEEIRGNLFLFTIAGFDTTANTMGYALTLLAIHPEWQDWVIEEIDRVFPFTTASDSSSMRIPSYK